MDIIQGQWVSEREQFFRLRCFPNSTTASWHMCRHQFMIWSSYSQKYTKLSSLSMHTQIYSALLMQFIIWKVSKHFLVSREQALCLKPVTKFLVLELHYITYFVDLPDRCTRSAYDLQKQTKPTVHPVHNRVPCSAVLRPQTKTPNILIQS